MSTITQRTLHKKKLITSSLLLQMHLLAMHNSKRMAKQKNTYQMIESNFCEEKALPA